MVTYADLGGLGAREGPPVIYTWEPLPPEPPVVAVTVDFSRKPLLWALILLPLFLLRQNRCAAAWAIWLPAVISVVAGSAIASLMGGSDSTLPEAACAFAVGVTAVWLLMPWLESRRGFRKWFLAVLALALFSVLAFLFVLFTDRTAWAEAHPLIAVLLALASVVVILALKLASRAVGHTFGCIGFLLRAGIWTLLEWTALAAPFVIIASFSSEIDWVTSALVLLGLTTVCLLILTPLVLMSVWQPFYRERFFTFLRLPQAPPQVIPTIPPVLPDQAESEKTAIVGGAGND